MDDINVREKLKEILAKDLVLRFPDHDALTNLDCYNATIQLLDIKVDEVIDKIMELFKNPAE